MIRIIIVITLFYSLALFAQVKVTGKVVNAEGNNGIDLRMNAKFKNTPCLECKIICVCNGGCSQNILENIKKDYCVNDFDKSKELEIVKNKFSVAIS